MQLLTYKRPGFADQTESVSCALDAVDAGHMENADRLVFLERVEESQTNSLFLVFLLISQLRPLEQQRVAFVFLADLDDVQKALADKPMNHFLRMVILNTFGIKDRKNVG